MHAPASIAEIASGRTDRIELAAPTAACELSIVVPAFEERENLPILMAELRAALLAAGRSWEIVLVDDGSRDGTGDWIAREAARDPQVIAVRLAENGGQSAALAPLVAASYFPRHVDSQASSAVSSASFPATRLM